MCFYTFAFECSRFVADDEVTGLENLHTIKTNAFFFFSQEQMIRGSNLCLEFRQTGMTVGNPCLEPQASSLPAERIGKIHESLQGSASLSAKLFKDFWILCLWRVCVSGYVYPVSNVGIICWDCTALRCPLVYVCVCVCVCGYNWGTSALPTIFLYGGS